MTTTTLGNTRFALLAIALVLLATPVAGEAQEIVWQPTIHATIGDGPDVLRAEAVELFENPARTREAAHVLRRESEKRTADDPESFFALAVGGRMFGYTGRLLDAQKMIEEAASVALARGEIERAAHTFVDAAWVARKRGKESKVRELVYRANLLTESPYLDDDARAAIQRRIGQSGGQVALGR